MMLMVLWRLRGTWREVEGAGLLAIVLLRPIDRTPKFILRYCLGQ